MVMAKATFIRVETHVLGIQFRLKQSAREILADFIPYTVKVMRERENEADPNAIQVYVDDPNMPAWDGRLLGYIPRGVAKEISPKWDAREISYRSGTVTSMDISEGTAEVTLRFKKSQRRKLRRIS
jgi:hypothetical protein